MKSLLKIICAAMAAVALMSSIIITAGCDDKTWDRVNDPIPTNALLLLGTIASQQQDHYTVTVFTSGIIGNWSGLIINIDGQVFNLSSTGSPTFTYSTLSKAISSVTVLQSPDLYSCSVTTFTPIYLLYILYINIQCNPS
jgi:hypothetical protein